MTIGDGRRSPGRWLGLVCLLVTPAAILAQAAPVPSPPAWLSGCWRQEGPTHTIEEVWLSPVGGTTVGVSRTVAADTLLLWEVMVIRPVAGELAFEAAPRGQPSVVFPVIEFTDSSLVFENRAHDFPQQIRYRRRSPDSLYATISGMVGGRSRTINFEYGRVACPDAPHGE
jgi:hypothetical protein